MKEFLREYANIVAYTFMGMIFAFASFYLILNLYHRSEVMRVHPIALSTDPSVINFNKNKNDLKTKLTEFDVNQYKGKLTSFQMMTAYQKLDNCKKEFDNEIITEILNKTELDVIDIYKLREQFENGVLGKCVVKELSWFGRAEENKVNSPYLLASKSLINNNINSVKVKTNYLKKVLINNSSYYFNTTMVVSTVKNDIRDGFYETISAYNDALNLTNAMADWFSREVKENK